MKISIKLFTLLLLLVMIIAGCKNNKDEPPLSDREITINLAEDWEFNQDLLFGTWKPVRFAYTKDGKNFSEVEESLNSNYTVEIEDGSYTTTQNSYVHRLQFSFFENYRFFYSTSSYFVSSISKLYRYDGGYGGIYYTKLTDIPNMVAHLIESGMMFDPDNNISYAEFLADFELNEPTGDEFKIYTVLEKAYSFVIRNDELFIYFTGIEKINLLVLKKN